jgi:hypothetical protein
VNRAQRRAARIKGPKGEPLEVRLLQILERGPDGRPTVCRIAYDDETLGEVLGMKPGDPAPKDKPEFLLVWMGEGQGVRPS